MPLYLDHNASTPPFPEVVDAMLPWLREGHANPHSDHVHGRRAAAAVEQAKASIGALVGADAEDVVLTSGATESNNLVLQGFLGGHGSAAALIHSAIEHACVVETGQALAAAGVSRTVVGVDRLGRIDAQAVRAAVDAANRARTLVSLIHANNEIGTVARLADVAAALCGSGALFHSDASQSAGWVNVDVGSEGVDFLTLSSHKVGGPMGVGAFYVAPDVRRELRPLTYGGGQQGGLRPGTVPVFLVVGFGVACELVAKRRSQGVRHAEAVAETFLDVLRERSVAFEVLGDPDKRLPGLRSVRLRGIDARDLLDRLAPRLSASTSSACAAGELRASHVLRAIGLTEEEAMEVVRFGLGRSTAVDEARAAAGWVCDAYEASRYAEA